jgi:hypothetical protein
VARSSRRSSSRPTPRRRHAGTTATSLTTAANWPS